MSFFGKKEEEVFETPLAKVYHAVTKGNPSIGPRPHEEDIPQEDPEVVKRNISPGMAVFLDDLRRVRDSVDVLIKRLSK